MDNLEVGVLGAVGVAGLFYTAVSVVGQIEDSLNHIWCVRRSRTGVERFRDYLSPVLVGPVLAVAVVALMATAHSSWLVQRILAIRELGWIIVVMTGLMPVLFVLVGFTVIYKLLPYTRVTWRAALVGGFSAALLWQFAGSLFATFAAGSTHYTAIYSGFAILILFLMWVYIGWMIVLIGGEAAYFCQYPRAALLSGAGDRRRFAEVAALRTFLEVARRHVAGSPPCEVEALAVQVGVPPGMLEEFVDECVRRGILLRGAEPSGIALGRAPESIPAAELLAILRGTDSSPRDEGAGDAVLELLRKRDRSIEQALDQITVRSLLEGQRPDPGKAE